MRSIDRRALLPAAGMALLADLFLSVSPQLVSAALALATAAAGVITFLSHGEARHWPAWLGLLLVLSIAFGGWQRLSDARGR
jgi:hypothetical protein